MIVKPAVENALPCHGASYFRDCGIAPGGQIPGSPPYQRIVWAEDEVAAIVAAFETFPLAQLAEM